MSRKNEFIQSVSRLLSGSNKFQSKNKITDGHHFHIKDYLEARDAKSMECTHTSDKKNK